MNTPIDDGYDDAIDFRALLARLWSKVWWIIASVVVCTSLFATAAFTITPIYRASVLLIPAVAERSSMSGSLSSALNQLGGLASLAGVSVGSSDAGTEEALAVLQSREFTGQFIADHQLLPQLFPKQWDATINAWKGAAGTQPTPAKAFEHFDKEVRSVKQDHGMVTLQIDWRDPKVAADWANELVERLNAEMRRRAIGQADAALVFLEKELVTTTVVDVRQAVNRLVEQQVKQRMLANVSQEYAFRVVDKATVPDLDSPIKPNKGLLLLLGPVVGFIVGVIGALVLGSWSTGAARKPEA